MFDFFDNIFSGFDLGATATDVFTGAGSAIDEAAEWVGSGFDDAWGLGWNNVLKAGLGAGISTLGDGSSGGFRPMNVPSVNLEKYSRGTRNTAPSPAIPAFGRGMLASEDPRALQNYWLGQLTKFSNLAESTTVKPRTRKAKNVEE